LLDAGLSARRHVIADWITSIGRQLISDHYLCWCAVTVIGDLSAGPTIIIFIPLVNT